MHFQTTISFSFFLTIYANIENDFIIEYFKYKRVASIVGFSCNIVEDEFHLVKGLNNINIRTSLHKLNNKHQIHLFANTYYWKSGVFIDLRCYDKQRIVSLFAEATEFRIYDELHLWLVIGSNMDKVMSVIDDRAFGMSTDFIVAIPSIDTGFEMYDVYNIWKKHGSNLNWTLFGFWNQKDHQFKIILNESKFSRRANLHGMTVKASCFYSKYKPSNISLVEYLQDYASPKDGISKFGFIIVNHLSDMFNFKLKYGEVPKWESGDANGPIISALVNNEIDLTGNPVTMNIKRTYLVKYVHQSWPFRTCFIFRSPQPKHIKIHEIFRPLNVEVWYLTVIFFAVGVWVMIFVLRYEYYKNEKNLQYSNSLLVMFGAMCQQGTVIKMNRLSTRISFLCIMIFGFLLYNYYSASVVSVRLNEPIFKINDSLNVLANTKLKFSSEWMVYFEFFIKKPDWETVMFYKQWAKVPETDRFISPEIGMELVRKGGFAYHTHPEVGYPFIHRMYDNREICELTEVHLAKPTLATFAVGINSTFVEMIKVGLTKISEVGLRQRQLLRWSSNKPRCLKNILSASSLNIYDFMPHLIILVFGVTLALIICTIENVKEIKKKPKRLKNTTRYCIRRYLK